MSSGHHMGVLPVHNQDLVSTTRNHTPEYPQLKLYQHLNVRHNRSQHGQPRSGPLSSGAGAATAAKPIRRRMRLITSCLECRRRKLKCNKSQPCANCFKFSRDCLYLGPKLDEASQLRLTEIKEKVGSLERQLERDVAKFGTWPRDVNNLGLHQQRILVDDDLEGELDEERDLDIMPMATLDLTYEDDADGMDDTIDLSVQIGKMRLTEKMSGLKRSRIWEEIQAGISRALPHRNGLSPGLDLSGFNSGPQNQAGPFPDPAGSDQSLPVFLRPSTSYISLTSGVFFGQFGQPPSLLTFLPTRPVGDRLLEHYFDAVHPIAKCVYRPWFQVQYESFWEEATAGYEPRTLVQSVVFATWFSASVAMDEHIINREFGFTKADLVENMKIGTEVALSKANFLRTTKVETMQAFVVYMIPLCREEVSRAHSVLVSTAIRMAECMGLHRDGSIYNLNPVETNVRRLIWHQLCFLDIRTCEAQGPRPIIRREDYDTRLPNDCEKDQLLTNPAAHSGPRQTIFEDWTSTLFPLIRFEVNEMMRTVLTDRHKLECRRTTLAQAIAKVETFRTRMLASYDHLLDERVPFQRHAKLVMHLLLYRLHVMVLQPYYACCAMPARLRSVLIVSAIVVVELAMELDTNPTFRLWQWYAGAYQQYQAALVLATEIYYVPGHEEASRIWVCLDYVFGLDDSMPSEEKGRHILMDIMEKTGAYMHMRKMRAPASTAAASPAQQALLKAEDELSLRPSDEAVDASRLSKPQQAYPHMKTNRPSTQREPGIASSVGPDPRLGASLDQSPSSGTATSVSLQQQERQQPMKPGTTSLPSHPHSQHGTPGPRGVMASYSSGVDLWGLALPPPLSPDSPENSSSDGGSTPGVINQRQGSSGGLAKSLSGVARPNWIVGEWSSYQEDALNAIFPFGPQTGSFAGLGDPSSSEVGHNGNGTWTQSRKM